VRRLGHRPALDGIRGIAIAGVVGVHFFGLSGGFFGVDLFFVLSGFLITTLLLEEHAATDVISLRNFYARRVRRLVPALGALLVVTGVVGSYAFSPGRLAEMLAYGALYAANAARAFVRPDPLAVGPLGPLWSLAQEEQFYLVWPLALVFLLRRRVGPSGLAASLAALFVVLVTYRAGLGLAGTSPARLYYAPDTHADGLVLGCLAGVLRLRGLRIDSRVGLGAIAALLALMGVGGESVAWNVFGLPAIELVAAAAILGALDPGPCAAVLSFRPLVWLGALSYSLYLWQGFALWLTGGKLLMISLGIASVLAVVSYSQIERPFRRRRTETVAGAPASAPGI
jgi:peptidoglycan/LPS O-acetylase OafA/YrhL